jgi:type III secretion protein R
VSGSGWMVALSALLPLVVLMLTSFAKVSVVLALLRNAIGATEAPNGLVVIGMSLVLTVFVMAPVATEVISAASATPAKPAPGPTGVPAPTGVPIPTGVPTPTVPAPVPAPGAPTAAPTDPAAPRPVDLEAAVRTLAGPDHQTDIDRAMRGIEPVRAFLTKHASQRDRDTFQQTSTKLGRATKGDELWVLAPAFLASELREAFMIAVIIFIPFLVIDLIVGLGLAALGLQSSSPQNVALPLKLLLFVAVDGWRLLLDSLLRGYA